MAIDVVVPALGESISEATVLNWRKNPGDPVARNEILVELETDKVTVEVEAPEDGVLLEIAAGDGDDVEVGAVIARIDAAGASPGASPETAVPAGPQPEAPTAPAADPEPEAVSEAPASEVSGDDPAADATGDRPDPFGPAGDQARSEDPAPPTVAEGPAPEPSPELPDPAQVRRSGQGDRITADDLREFLGAPDRPLSPAARRAAREHAVDPAAVTPTGPGGRILKADVLAAAGDALPPAAGPGPGVEPATAPADGGPDAPPPVAAASEPAGEAGGPSSPEDSLLTGRPAAPASAGTRRVPMSRLRRRLAERLKEAQNTAAMLTTYNEVDMGAVMELRKASGPAFEQRHGVRLGLMSFFVKASVSALRTVPEVSAEIDGTDIVYKDFYDIGVAVNSDRGLVVPVIRGADRKGFADIEREIRSFSERAGAGALEAHELEGGTFTVSNGGVYGSLMSAPILNPPQSGILGLHRIQDRPVARAGQVVIRPMMYLALSYDHRIVDGKGAVTFLVHLRDLLEQPAALALDT